MEAEIISILDDAEIPITINQIMNAYTKRMMENPDKALPKVVKKDVNSILYKLKGEKLQIYNQYSPPSWCIIGKFK